MALILKDVGRRKFVLFRKGGLLGVCAGGGVCALLLLESTALADRRRHHGWNRWHRHRFGQAARSPPSRFAPGLRADGHAREHLSADGCVIASPRCHRRIRAHLQSAGFSSSDPRRCPRGVRCHDHRFITLDVKPLQEQITWRATTNLDKHATIHPPQGSSRRLAEPSGQHAAWLALPAQRQPCS